MAAPNPCPTCSSPMRDGICQVCALSAAISVLNTTDAATDPLPETSSVPDDYQLLHKLGSGGMGVVWLARERKLDRLVALKTIAAAADPRLAQRLIREGQAAARLRHPNIVSVHALGSSERGVFLAMDFLPGGDLRQRLANGLPATRVAAEWVAQLGGALAHAHASGILHRDIKPSNVLLGEDDEPHLADFGLAVPLEGGGDLTMPGQLAGSAAYLAPELLDGADNASVASDVYGLGAVLYECLTGRAPFVGDSAAAILGQLRENDPAPPRLVRPDVPRDLETICLKCLEKSPARRYAGAEALRDDLGRFLRDEPIAARPIGKAGRAMRWCKRHPGTAAFAGSTAVLLVGLAIGGPLVAIRLARANARAQAEAEASKAVSDFLQNDLLARAAPEVEPDRDLKLRTVLDRAAGSIDGRFPEQPMVEADVRDTLAATYYSLGEYLHAVDHWTRVREMRTRELGALDRKTLAAASHLFDSMLALGRYPEADALGVDVLETQRRVLGPADPETLHTMIQIAQLRRRQNRLGEAEALYTEALGLWRGVSGPESSEALATANNLAVLYRHQRKLAEAESLHRQTLEIRRRVLGPEHPDTLHSMSNLAVVLKEAGRQSEAEPLAAEALSLRERILGPEHPYTLVSMTTLSAILQDQSKLEEAGALAERALEIERRTLGFDHPETLILMSNLGSVYREQGKLDAAERILNETLVARRRTLGNTHTSTLITLGQLARVYQQQGNLDEALALVSEGIATFSGSEGISDQLRSRFGKLREELIQAGAKADAAGAPAPAAP